MLEARYDELGQVEAKYGAKEYSRARKFAGIVFEENDPRVVEEIIMLVRERGLKKVNWAFAEVGRKNIDNPKRSFVYVLGMLK